MKKIIISIICLLSIFSSTNAFFGSPTSLDLYKNIDNGIIDLEKKMIGFELKGGEENLGIIKQINKLSILEKIPVCLNEGKKISENELNRIILKNDIDRISTYISNNCKDSSGKITIETLNNILNLFKIYQNKIKQTAIKKTSQIYKLSNIGLYSDGNLENSGFDLIVDIENIDKIIFASKTEYEGVASDNIDKTLNDMLGSVIEAMDKIDNPNNNTIPYINNDTTSTINNIYRPNSTYNPLEDNQVQPDNNYICSEDINDNGLSEENLTFLLNNINNNLKSNNVLTIENSNNTSNGIEGNNQTSENNINDNLDGNYDKVRDNSEWPCEKFFCINIDFIMYEHNLFGGGENITIEYLLKRSNEHLRKYASTSLIPAKMGLNNFEIGLKHLNMPDIFHLGIQILTKPIPILNIEDKSKRDDTEYSAKNMLEAYYKANGLNYKRRNDLVLLKNIEQEKQTILNSKTLTIDTVFKKNKEYFDVIYDITEFGKYLSENKKIEFLNKSIEKKVSYGILQTFEKQYIELEKFTVGINNYINNLHSIIGAMKTIPIDKS